MNSNGNNDCDSLSLKLPQKRPVPESASAPQIIPSTQPTSYTNRNEEYISNGMSQYTIQFLRKMTNLNQSIL